MFKKASMALVLCAALVVMTGCSSGGGGLNRITVWGKVIDFSTQAGIADATVKLYVGKSVKSTTTASDNTGTTDYNEAGDFEIKNVPDGTHRLRVVQSGYAIYEEWVVLEPNNQDSSGATYYFAANSDTDGKINLIKGCDLDVY